MDIELCTKGTLLNLEGASYRGEFWNGLRHGHGIEEFGNNFGMKYDCPLGHKHKGIAFCKYEGSYSAGLFHGKGEFCCQDGRYV